MVLVFWNGYSWRLAMVFLFFTFVSSRENGHKPRDGSTRASDPDERQNAKLRRRRSLATSGIFASVDAIKRALAIPSSGR